MTTPTHTQSERRKKRTKHTGIETTMQRKQTAKTTPSAQLCIHMWDIYIYIYGYVYFQQAMLSTHTHTHLLNPLVRLLLGHGEDADWVQPHVSFNWLIVQPRHRSSRKLLASVMRRPQHERHGVSWFEQIYKTVLHNRSRTNAIWTD